jgi:hypothetical protein
MEIFTISVDKLWKTILAGVEIAQNCSGINKLHNFSSVSYL